MITGSHWDKEQKDMGLGVLELGHRDGKGYLYYIKKSYNENSEWPGRIQPFSEIKGNFKCLFG